MKQLFLSIFCLILANLASAQIADTTSNSQIKKTSTTTKVTTTTVVVTEKLDTIRKKPKRVRVDTQKQNIVKLGFLSFHYERAISKKVTAQFITHYKTVGEGSASSGNNTPILQTESSGLGVGAELRFYPKSALNGFFVAFSPRYQNYNFTVPNGVTDNNGNVSDAKANWNSYNVALLVGQQWIFKDKFSLDIYAGPALVGGVFEIIRGTRDAFTLFGTGANTGVTLRAGLSFGFVY